MNLKRLTIYGFGHFHDRTFDLSSGLNFLVGPNEAGKSTLTQFITAIFFGFPTKKHPELRYEPLDGSRFGGAITFQQDNTTYTVTRTDGPKGGTVTLHDDTTNLDLPAALLTKLLAPVDGQLFTRVYAINEPRLGTVFTASKQELVDRLRHVGAVGSEYWLQQAQRLDQAADDRYKPQGRNPLLNQQLREHQELSAKLAKANGAYQTYWQLRQQQVDGESQQRSLQATLTQQRQATTRLTQLLAQWPTYQQWMALAPAVEAVSHGFTATDATRLEQLRSAATASEQTLTDDQQRFAELQRDQQLPPLFDQYLPVADKLDALAQRLPQVQGSQQEAQRLVTSQRDLEQRAGILEQQYAVNGQMPRPFSLATTQQVRQLTGELTTANQKRRRLQQQLNQRNEQFRQVQPTRQQHHNPLADKQVGWLAAGLVVLVGAMFLPNTFLKLAGALLGVAVGYYGVFLVDSSTPASRQLDELTEDIRDLQAQLREGGQAVDALTNQLDAIGDAHGMSQVPLEQWSAAQSAIAEWERLTRLLETTAEQAATQQATVQQFLQEATTILPALADQDFAAVASQLMQLQATRQALSHQETDVAALATRLQADQAAVERGKRELQAFLRTRNLSDVAAFYQQYQADRTQTERQQQRQSLATQIGSDNLTTLQQQTSQTALQQQVTMAQQKQVTTQATLDQTTSHLATLQGQLAHLTASGTQATLRQKLADLETQMTQTAATWLTERLVSQWISAALAAASGDRLPQIVAQASEFYGKLTENRYTKIELTPTTLRVQRATGDWRNVGQLSRGTAEQLDLAVTLAFAVVMNRQVQMPLIIDDGFVNFDEARRQAAYRLLATIATDVQVILLTADESVTTHTTGTGKVLRLTE